MTELDDRLREHYSKVSLDTKVLNRIHAAAYQDEVSPVDQKARDSRFKALVSKLKGMLLLRLSERGSSSQRIKAQSGASVLRYAVLGTVIVGVGVSMRMAGSMDERGERAMREVAMNHATRLSFEFEGESLAALDRGMNQLPFVLSEPSRLPDDVRVLGSRYCSLSGQLAAHVKLREGETGRPLSLFVTNSATKLDQLNGESGYVDGVEVELFHEGGLFYALARQPD